MNDIRKSDINIVELGNTSNGERLEANSPATAFNRRSYHPQVMPSDKSVINSIEMGSTHDVARIEANSPASAYTRLASAVNSSPRVANPQALGLFSFASTTFILSMYNMSTRGITTPNAVVGMAVFCGGLVQLLAGMWEFPNENMYGATAFSSYGAFWMSYATILIPGSGIIDAYTSSIELGNALGIYLFTWFIVTFFFLITSLRKSIAFIALFGFLSVTFILLGTGEFTGTTSVTKAGGLFGIITAFVAYYIGLSHLLRAEKHPVIRLPLGEFYPLS